MQRLEKISEELGLSHRLGQLELSLDREAQKHLGYVWVASTP